MAATSLWRVKYNLPYLVRYILDPEKTEQGLLVSGLNCDPEHAAEEMLQVKKHFGKTGGVLAYHGYQSFKEGEVTPEQAHMIGCELAERLWGSQYQVLIATHVDKRSHIHNHLLLNTVSLADGRKYHRTESDYRQFMDLSDQLCREHGLSVIRHPEDGKGISHAEWAAGKEGRPTSRGMIRRDIDKAVLASITERDFFRRLEEMGYEVKLRGKNGKRLERPSLKPAGSSRYYRFDRLGDGYDLEEIMFRILDHIRRTPVISEEEREEIRKYREHHPPHPKAKGLAALYYHYCYELHILKEHPYAVKKVSAAMREDLKKLERLDEQTRLLGQNGIETEEGLCAFQERLRSDLEECLNRRRIIKKQNQALLSADRSGDPALETVLSELSRLTGQIKTLRKEIRACDQIRERSEDVAEQLRSIREQPALEAAKAQENQRRRKERAWER